MAKQTTKAEENIQAVEQALSRTEQFIEDKQKPLLIVIGVLVVVILAFFGFQRFYLQPQEVEANQQMYMAEKYFNMDSMNLALNGDGINLGLLDVIEDYKWTKSANLAHYYTGIVYMKKGDFPTAIDYLNNFSADDNLLEPMALGALGDCFIEMDNTKKAVDYYLQAADANSNELTTPTFLMKAGWGYELQDSYKNAVDVYTKIKTDFPKSQEAREIDKYIAYAQGMIR